MRCFEKKWANYPYYSDNPKTVLVFIYRMTLSRTNNLQLKRENLKHIGYNQNYKHLES